MARSGGWFEANATDIRDAPYSEDDSDRPAFGQTQAQALPKQSLVEEKTRLAGRRG